MMTREECLAWMHQRFDATLIERDPDWVETMIILLQRQTRWREHPSLSGRVA